MPYKYLIRLIIFLFFLLIINSANADKMNALHKQKVFVCPMHNHIRKDHSGKCPICGMNLIFSKELSGKTPVISLSPNIKQALKLLTENVRPLTLQKEIYSGTKLVQVSKPETQITIELLKPNLKWLKEGSLVEAEAKDDIRGVHTWTGKITHIATQPNDVTHRYPTTISLRTPYSILKPNMYLTLTLYGDAHKSLVIPFKAVIFNSDNRTHAVKVVGKNQYQTVLIVIGIRQDHLVEVIDGLDEHDKVITDGQFLIRAEQQLRSHSHD